MGFLNDKAVPELCTRYHQYHLKRDILNLTELGKNMDIKQPFLHLFLPKPI